MKKVLSLVLCVMMLASMMVVTSNAAYSKTEAPDWLITKICPDTCDFEGIYPSVATSLTGDIFEAFEIVNISGKTLNLYDYGVTYNGNSPTNERFETVIWEFTPFKPGDYRDGSNFSWEGMPTNPETCMVEPGEVVVIWSLFIEAWGNNATMKDFRTFWQIPDNVKVIAWDGNSSTKEFQKGNDKNFNLKNSGMGSYGIAKNDGSVIEETSPYDDVITWTNMDFNGEIVAISNLNFIAVFGYDAKSDDVRRAKFLDYTDEVKFGVLSDAQKESLGDLLKAREDTKPADTTKPITTTPTTADPMIVYAMIAMVGAAALVVARKKVK